LKISHHYYSSQLFDEFLHYFNDEYFIIIKMFKSVLSVNALLTHSLRFQHCDEAVSNTTQEQCVSSVHRVSHAARLVTVTGALSMATAPWPLYALALRNVRHGSDPGSSAGA
jgi:hypothetical protein